MSQWYYQKLVQGGDPERIGPIQEAGLYGALCSGTVNWDSFVWTDGQGAWTELKNVQTLRDAFGPTGPYQTGKVAVASATQQMAAATLSGTNPEPKADDGAPAAGGYKVSAKKTMDELNKLDAGDESLQKYKAQLMGGTAQVIDGGDQRLVFIDQLVVICPERPEGHYTLQTADLDQSKRAFVLKEASQYALQIRFRVQRDIVSALKFTMNVKKKGITVNTTDEMMGSYAPKGNDTVYTFQTPVDEAPSGFLGRGKYTGFVTLTDDDKRDHGNFAFEFKVGKKWE